MQPRVSCRPNLPRASPISCFRQLSRAVPSDNKPVPLVHVPQALLKGIQQRVGAIGGALMAEAPTDSRVPMAQRILGGLESGSRVDDKLNAAAVATLPPSSESVATCRFIMAAEPKYPLIDRCNLQQMGLRSAGGPVRPPNAIHRALFLPL